MSQRESVGSGSCRDVTPTHDDNKSTKGHDEKSAVGQEASVTPPAVGSQERPYSVFTAREKWFLVALCGLAAMYRSAFSSLSLHCSFLYLTLH